MFIIKNKTEKYKIHCFGNVFVYLCKIADSIKCIPLKPAY